LISINLYISSSVDLSGTEILTPLPSAKDKSNHEGIISWQQVNNGPLLILDPKAPAILLSRKIPFFESFGILLIHPVPDLHPKIAFIPQGSPQFLICGDLGLIHKNAVFHPLNL